MTVWLSLFNCNCLVHHIVCTESLKSAYTNRLTLDTSYTLALTLMLLWTYTSANSRQSVCCLDDSISFFKLALCYLCDKLRNPNAYRTSCHTRLVLAVKTSLSFFYSLLRGVTQSNFLEVSSSYLWLLLCDRSLCQTHISHYLTPPVSLHK